MAEELFLQLLYQKQVESLNEVERAALENVGAMNLARGSKEKEEAGQGEAAESGEQRVDKDEDVVLEELPDEVLYRLNAGGIRNPSVMMYSVSVLKFSLGMDRPLDNIMLALRVATVLFPATAASVSVLGLQLAALASPLFFVTAALLVHRGLQILCGSTPDRLYGPLVMMLQQRVLLALIMQQHRGPDDAAQSTDAGHGNGIDFVAAVSEDDVTLESLIAEIEDKRDCIYGDNVYRYEEHEVPDCIFEGKRTDEREAARRDDEASDDDEGDVTPGSGST